MYRTAIWNEYQRSLDKILKSKNWYGSDTESVVFVQATPGEVLRKAVQREANLSRLKVKVVEKGGADLKSLLQRSDVQPMKSCHKNNCVVCLTSEKGQCSAENIGYRVHCKPCAQNGVVVEMHGETGRCARVRCGEHQRLLKMFNREQFIQTYCV